MVGHIGIPMEEEETTSFSSLASCTNSTYGLVSDQGGGQGHGPTDPHRTRVVQKYTSRCKMLGALTTAVLIIGGSAMFIAANNGSTEVLHEPQALGGEVKPDSVPTKDPNVFVVPPKQKQTPQMDQSRNKHSEVHSGLEGSHVDATKQDLNTSAAPDHISPKNGSQSTIALGDDHKQGQVSADVSNKKTTPEDESEMQSDEPDTAYNPLANCTNHVKNPPKKADEVPSTFIPLEKEPVGLLYAMRECPTFSYDQCVFRDSKKHGGFKAFIHIRSTNRTYTGFDAKTKKKAKKDAAYRAALALYPQTQNSGATALEISPTLRCTRI